jgi:hypothetical protein
MMDIVKRLRRWSAEESTYELLSDAADEIERLRGALRDIYEVYAGSEGIPKPMTAAEGYLLQQLMEAARIAARALAGKIEEAK